jgi:hypothetical protein
MKKGLTIIFNSLAILAMVFAAVAIPGLAADHLDAPFVKMDGRIDINDVYVFHPGQAGSQDLSRTVLAMTVNPAAGVISGKTFRDDASYDLVVDQDGDAVEDMVISTDFGPVRNGRQNFTVTLQDKNGGYRVLAKGTTGGDDDRDGEDMNKSGGGVKVFAGLRDDPFFFDLNSFNEGATFCEDGDTDFFLGLNVSAIVVEVPTSLLGEGPVGIWGRTSLPVNGVADRMGRPAILTVFIPPNPFEAGDTSLGNLEDVFNFNKPLTDQMLFREEIVNSLTVLFSLNDAAGDDTSDDAQQIQDLADILLPDILTVDLSLETAFLNGRNLSDDVIDAELGLVTEGAVTTDCIDNDSTFLKRFPYLGRPNRG